MVDGEQLMFLMIQNIYFMKELIMKFQFGALKHKKNLKTDMFMIMK